MRVLGVRGERNPRINLYEWNGLKYILLSYLPVSRVAPPPSPKHFEFIREFISILRTIRLPERHARTDASYGSR